MHAAALEKTSAKIANYFNNCISRSCEALYYGTEAENATKKYGSWNYRLQRLCHESATARQFGAVVVFS